MIIAVDSSALIAILEEEREAAVLATCLGGAAQSIMSAATYLECGIVFGKHLRSSGVDDRLGKLMRKAEIEVVPFGVAEAEVGLEAYQRFGKGTGHPAQLNFGDCFSYALAKTRNLPLLFKGDDFTHTDITPALKPGA